MYADLTAPLLDAFAEHGRLVLVDGTGTKPRVARRVERALRAWRLRPSTAAVPGDVTAERRDRLTRGRL